jgi:hypothetical protein
MGILFGDRNQHHSLRLGPPIVSSNPSSALSKRSLNLSQPLVAPTTATLRTPTLPVVQSASDQLASDQPTLSIQEKLDRTKRLSLKLSAIPIFDKHEVSARSVYFQASAATAPLVQREAVPQEKEELQTKPLVGSDLRVQRKCANCEEEEQLQTKSLSTAHTSDFSPVQVPTKEQRAPANDPDIQRQAEPERPLSYVFAGDKRLSTDKDFAQNRGREIAARIRKNGGEVSYDDNLELKGMLDFFQGEAKEVYRQQVNDYSGKIDPNLIQLVKMAEEELKRDSPRDKVLLANIISGFKLDPRQWALELKAKHHHKSGNYLLLFFEKLPEKYAGWFKNELATKGVVVDEILIEWELHKLLIEEQSKLLKVDLKNYPIYEWKVVLGEQLKPFVEAVNLIIHFVPILGQALGAFEGLIGREVLTGRKLAGWERLLGILPYAGTLLKAGKSGAQAVLTIARQTGISPDAALRLVKNASTLSSEVDRLREIKKIVDAGGQLSVAQQRTLRTAYNSLKPLEKEVEQVAKETAKKSTKETAEAAVKKGGKESAESVGKAAGKQAVKAEVVSEVPIKIGGTEHSIKVLRRGNQVECVMCSVCEKMIASINKILEGISATGRTKNFRRRFEELQKKVTELENLVMSRSLTQGQTTHKIHNIAGDLDRIAKNYGIKNIGNFPKVRDQVAEFSELIIRSKVDSPIAAEITTELIESLYKGATDRRSLKQFVEALGKGMASRAHGAAGIKELTGTVRGFTHELKILGSGSRLLGKMENGSLVFRELTEHL